MLTGEPLAVLATVTVPVSLPAALGLKTTPNVNACPAVSVTGADAPLRLNPVPLSLICETVTFAFPEFVTLTFCVAEDPSFTLPNPIFVVLNVSNSVAATPVPLRPITEGEFGALLTMVTLPEAAPADVGAN